MHAVQQCQLDVHSTLANLAHKSLRDSLRRVFPHMMASEQEIVQEKYRMASECGTETNEVCYAGVYYAYLVDPILFLRYVIAEYSCTVLLICGDKGSDTTKLGVTFRDHHQTLVFMPLLIYTGADDYEGLELKGAPLPMKGESSCYKGIWHMFNSLKAIFTTVRIKLCGDWMFLNAVVGLLSPASLYPCFKCLAPSAHLFSHHAIQQPRTPATYERDLAEYNRLVTINKAHKVPASQRHLHHSVVRAPLFDVDPKDIVPLPLHAVLGLVNLFVEEIKRRVPKRNKASFNVLLKSIKHSTPHTGRASIYALNGHEIENLLSEKMSMQQKFMELLDEKDEEYDKNKQRVNKLFYWSSALYRYLLPKRALTSAEKDEISQVISEIWGQWSVYIHPKQQPTPKAHMLIHIMEYIEEYDSVGLYGESALESFHHTFNELSENYSNCGSDKGGKLRGALADTALKVSKRKHIVSVKSRMCSKCHLPLRISSDYDYCQCESRKRARLSKA